MNIHIKKMLFCSIVLNTSVCAGEHIARFMGYLAPNFATFVEEHPRITTGALMLGSFWIGYMRNKNEQRKVEENIKEIKESIKKSAQIINQQREVVKEDARLLQTIVEEHKKMDRDVKERIDELFDMRFANNNEYSTANSLIKIINEIKETAIINQEIKDNIKNSNVEIERLNEIVKKSNQILQNHLIRDDSNQRDLDNKIGLDNKEEL